MKKLVVVGATSLMAQSCARLWVESSEYSSVVLIGRNKDKLEDVAKDLQTRGGTSLKVEVRAGDMVTADGVEQLVNQACEGDLPDTVLLAHGYMPDQGTIDGSPRTCVEVLKVTGVSPVLFLQSFAMKLKGNSSAHLAVIGSVAGDRGRASNYIYGASKAMIAAAAEGLTQRFGFESGPMISLIKPGPTSTPMTASMENRKMLAPVEDVAKCIVNGVNVGRKEIYAPFKWIFIMFIVRHLPYFIFNRVRQLR